MKRYKGYVSTDKIGSKVEFEFVMDDDATDEEAHDMAMERMWEHIEMNYEEVESRVVRNE